MPLAPDFSIIKSLFRFGLPTGVQGIAMNIAGVMLLGFIGSLEYSAAAQAAYAVGYTELFSLISWTSVGLMGAAATISGQNLGAGNPERAMHGVAVASRIGLAVAAGVGVMFLTVPQYLLAVFGMTRASGHLDWRPAASVSESLGTLHFRRADLHRRAARHGRHAKPAVHHPGVADRRADRPLLALPGDARSAGRRHLAGDPPRPLHARRPERARASAKDGGGRSPWISSRREDSPGAAPRPIRLFSSASPR